MVHFGVVLEDSRNAAGIDLIECLRECDGAVVVYFVLVSLLV